MQTRPCLSLHPWRHDNQVVPRPRVRAGGQHRVLPGAKQAVFEVRLSRGTTRLQTWFLDDRGRELCGAFYVEVERL